MPSPRIRQPLDVPAPGVHLGRNRELDWLRAYAILCVVLEHATMVKPFPTVWSGIVHHWYEGRNGVDLFFVISGFVISKSFLDRFDAGMANGRAALEAAAFYLMRLVRLWPAAAFWALVILLGSIATRGTPNFPPPDVSFEKLVAAVTYTSNWSEIARPTPIGHYYSLATEMQFYLLLPPVLFLVAPRYRLAAAGTALLAGFVIPGVEAQAQTRFAGIVVGIALYLLSRDTVAPRMEPTLLRSRTASGVFTATILALLVVCTLPPMSAAAESHVAALVASLLVGAAIYRRGYVSCFGMPRILDWIGSRSYSIYLCHIPIMLLDRAVFFDFGVRDGANVAAQRISDPLLLAQWLASIVLASELTFRLLERPSTSLARRLGAVLRRPSGRASSSTAHADGIASSPAPAASA